LSRELIEIAGAARAAALAADSYGPHALAERAPTRGPMGFVVLSDSLPAMRALLPGVSDKTIRELTAPDHSDYRAIVYRDPLTKAIHVTFRGTQSSQDWEQGNIPQALGFDSEYYRKAAELGRLLKQAADAEGVRLEIVGHSMGGGMAADATLAAVAQCERNPAIACNVHGTTFNAAGLHASSMPRNSLATANRYIDSYVVPGEMLTALQDIRAFPKRYSEPVERLLSDIALGIDVANAAPESVGRRTTLPLDWFPRPSILKAVYDWKALLDDVLIPLELHRMRSVRQAILRRSEDLKRQYTTRCALPKVARVALNAVSADPPAPKALQERIDGSVDWNDARRHLQLLKKLRSNTDLTTAERAELAAGSSNFSRARQALSDLRRAAPDEMEEVRLLKIPVLRRSLAVAEKDVVGANSTIDSSRDIGMLGSAMITGDAAARAIASAWAISCPFPNVCPPAMFLLARGLPSAAAEVGNTGQEAWTLLSEKYQEHRVAGSIGRNGAPGAGNPPGRADAAAGGEDNAKIALAGAKGIIAGHEAIDGAAKLGTAAGMKAIWTHAHLDAWQRIGGGLSALDNWSQFVKQRKMRIKAGQTSWSAEEKQAFGHFFGDAGTALGFKGGGVITAGADVVKGMSDFRAARALVAPVAGPANSILRSKLSARESALSLQRELLRFDAVEPQRPVQASSAEAGAANAGSRP
jgi:hypothetical protein